MKTLQTLTTIELSSLCNLTCKYCINRLMALNGRRPGIMTDETFETSVRLLEKLCARGTQQEVNLNGNGESLLDPQLVNRVRRVKETVGFRKVQFCTNGVLLTRTIAEGLKDAGITSIDLSVHDAYHARRCAHMLFDLGILGTINFGTIVATHNWAGQLEPEHQVAMRISLPCHPLMEGRGYIDSDGQITPCCYDYLRKGVYTNVFDPKVLDRQMKPFSLCKTCHQIIPEEARQ